MNNINNNNTAYPVACRCWCDKCTILYHAPDVIRSHTGPLPQMSMGVLSAAPAEGESSKCSLNMPREKRGFDSSGAVNGPGPSWDTISEEDRELEDCMIFVRSNISWCGGVLSVTADGTEVLKLGWKRGYRLFAEMDGEYIEDVDSGVIDREENHRPTKRRRLNS